MQSIVNHVIDGREYEYSSMMDRSLSMENKSMSLEKPVESNILDRIDGLLNALNEPNYSVEIHPKPSDAFTALIAAADSCFNDEKSSLESR